DCRGAATPPAAARPPSARCARTHGSRRPAAEAHPGRLPRTCERPAAASCGTVSGRGGTWRSSVLHRVGVLGRREGALDDLVGIGLDGAVDGAADLAELLDELGHPRAEAE